MDFGNDTNSNEFTEPFSNLEGINWRGKDIRCRFHPEASPSKANRYLADAIRVAVASESIPVTEQYRIDRLGGYLIKGIPIFCTGGRIIQPSSSTTEQLSTKLEPMPFNLDIDPTLTEAEAVNGILTLVSLYPNAGRIDLAHNLLYLMRMLYEDAWKSPCVIVYKYGLTGTQKTTTAALITQIYDRSKGIESPPSS